jgi:hypothetical protein
VGILALGWGRPLGQGGSGGWDWWALVGLAALLMFMLRTRRMLPLAPTIFLAAMGGLILGDLTHAWGIAPVWGTFLLVVLLRTLRRGHGRSRV